MTQKEAMNQMVSDGVPFVVAEVRGVRTEVIRWKNQKTGQEESFDKHTAFVEVGSSCQQASVGSREPFPDTWKKGVSVVIALTGMQWTKGHLEYNTKPSQCCIL